MHHVLRCSPGVRSSGGPLVLPPQAPSIHPSRPIFPQQNSIYAANLSIQGLHCSASLRILFITQPSHLSPLIGVTCIKDGLFYAPILREVRA